MVKNSYDSMNSSNDVEFRQIEKNEFSNKISDKLNSTKRRNFNIITLVISIPLYSILGYYIANYFQYEKIDNTTGALIGGIGSCICSLYYNNMLAVLYEGYEYLFSILFTGAVLLAGIIAIALLYAVVSIIIAILSGLFVIVLIFLFLAGLGGG